LVRPTVCHGRPLLLWDVFGDDHTRHRYDAALAFWRTVEKNPTCRTPMALGSGGAPSATSPGTPPRWDACGHPARTRGRARRSAGRPGRRRGTRGTPRDAAPADTAYGRVRCTSVSTKAATRSTTMSQWRSSVWKNGSGTLALIVDALSQ